MLADAPTLVPAAQAVAAYAERHQADLPPEHCEVLLEIGRRLERLGAQAVELIDINNRMWEKRGLKVDFDPSTDTFIASVGGVEQRLKVKVKRADPNVPLEIKDATAGSVYHAGAAPASDEEEQRLRLQLEEKLESYYQSAHRVLKLFGRVPGLPKIRCVAISRIRNELIEHANDALYSFGVGSTGPRVKPMFRGTQKFNDEGLLPNTSAFVDAIVAGLLG
jgi:hypothetical protein